MSKQTRQQKKGEEQRIIKEMEEALLEAKGESVGQTPPENSGKKSVYATEPKQIHCRRCKTLMENGVCPTCGYKIYMPMNDTKRNKIRLITAIVFIVIGVIVFAISKA